MDSIRCFVCQGPYNEATGNWMGPLFADVFYCGPCAEHMLKFVKGMMNRPVGRDESEKRKDKKRKKISGKTAGFYDAAVTSIRPKWTLPELPIWYIPITAPETLPDEAP